MKKNVRRLIVRYEDRLLDPPFDSWGPLRHAVLECGHVLRAVGSLTHKRMACTSCGGSNQDLDPAMRSEARPPSEGGGEHRSRRSTPSIPASSLDLTLRCPTCGKRADMCFEHGDDWKKRDASVPASRQEDA